MTDGESLELFQIHTEPRRRGKKTIKAPLLRAEKKTISSISTSIETNTLLVDVQRKAVGTDLDAIIGNAANGNTTGNSACILSAETHGFANELTIQQPDTMQSTVSATAALEVYFKHL
jgi:hypothetical protein